MKKSEEFVRFNTKLLRETKVSYIITFGVDHIPTSIPKKCSYYFSDSIYILSEICRRKRMYYSLEQIYNINEIEDKINNTNTMKTKEKVVETVKENNIKGPRIPAKILYYHSREKSTVTVCAIVQNSLSSPNSVVTFGFSKCKKGDQFSKKYGREQAFLRADEDPRAVLVFKDFKPSQFVTTAKKLVNEINHVTDWGKSLVSSVLLSNELTTLW